MPTILQGQARSIQAKSTNTDGSVDFLSSYISIKDRENIPLMGYVFIDKNTVGRIDIIVNHYYGTTELLDIFLKFNGIDNMFAAPIGTRILIPEKYALENAIEYISTDTKQSLNNNKKEQSFSKRKNSNWTKTPSESVINSRSKLQNRGNGFTVVAPGVLKF